MKRLFSVLLGGLIAAVAAMPSLANEVRVPAAGTPYLSFVVPDSWVVGEVSGGIINVADANPPTVVVSVSLLRDSRSPDVFIREEMQQAGGPAAKRTSGIEISGIAGWSYTSTGRSASGRELLITHRVATVDGRYILAVMTMYPSDTPESAKLSANNIVNTVRLNR